MSENGETRSRVRRKMNGMPLDPVQCHRALVARDARFDGKFFVGVKTTGIYCRPVCTAKVPAPKNCEFFVSAAAAEREAYRPCLRCRPELAPGNAAVDAAQRIAAAAASMIEEHLGAHGIPDLASALAISDRHLRRVFRQEFGVSPIEFAQTQRLLLAKRLLTETTMPIVDVASASGFGSVRRFNALFRARYRFAPRDLRRKGEREPVRDDGLAFELAYRPPYDWSSIVSFLERRAIAGVEAVDARSYRRTIRLDCGGRTHLGYVEVSPQRGRNTLRVLVSPSLGSAIPAVLSRVKRLFDLACRPDQIGDVLGELAVPHPGMRVPGAVDGFEVAVRAILGQQVTVLAATRIAGRFATAFGDPIATPHGALTALFPRPETVAEIAPEQIAAVGVIASRARAIVHLARAIARAELRLDWFANVEETLADLEAVPGIGPWTAHYIAMRALAWPDAFPHPDVAVLRALGESNRDRALSRCEAWRPFRAYAVMHLWRSLDDGVSATAGSVRERARTVEQLHGSKRIRSKLANDGVVAVGVE